MVNCKMGRFGLRLGCSHHTSPALHLFSNCCMIRYSPQCASRTSVKVVTHKPAVPSLHLSPGWSQIHVKGANLHPQSYNFLNVYCQGPMPNWCTH